MTSRQPVHHLFGDVPRHAARCDQQPGCEGYGITVSEEGRVAVCTCQIGRAHRAAYRAEQAGIPAKHYETPALEITSQRLVAIVGAVERWESGFETRRNSGLLLTGRSRTGKSHIAGAIAVRMLGRLTDPFAVGARCPIVWISWPEYLCRIRDTFSRGHGSDETESDILDELSGASIAIIDDLGAEPRTTTDWAEGTLCRVLERAVSSLSPTLVLTSNLSLAEIGGRYGERVMGRITEAVSGPGGGILAFGNVPNYFDHQGKR